MNFIKNLFSKRDRYPHFVEARLVEQITPEDRGDFYEKPLKKFLESKGLGTITGGGTLLAPRAQEGEMDIEYVGLDVELRDLDEALDATKQKLLELGVPVGSSLSYESGEKRVKEPIGTLEILNVFIDNTLDRAFFEAIEFSDLVKALSDRLAANDAGKHRYVCQWPSETLIYFVGPDADAMYEAIKSLPDEIAVLQNARITFQRMDPTREPLELRLPFRES